MLAGMMARPRATSARTNSGVMGFAICDLRLAIGSEPGCAKSRSFRARLEVGDRRSEVRPAFSRIAMYSISGVMMPRRAYASCVTAPFLARNGFRWNLGFEASLELGFWDLELPLR